jgi:hypothetical protein
MSSKLPPGEHAVIVGRESPRHEWQFITFASKLETAWHSAFHIQRQERMMARPKYETGVLTQGDYESGHTRRLIKAPAGMEYYSEPPKVGPNEKLIEVKDRPISAVPVAPPALQLPKNAVIGEFKSAPKQEQDAKREQRTRRIRQAREEKHKEAPAVEVTAVPQSVAAKVVAAAEPNALQANLAAFLSE